MEYRWVVLIGIERFYWHSHLIVCWLTKCLSINNTAEIRLSSAFQMFNNYIFDISRLRMNNKVLELESPIYYHLSDERIVIVVEVSESHLNVIIIADGFSLWHSCCVPLIVCLIFYDFCTFCLMFIQNNNIHSATFI